MAKARKPQGKMRRVCDAHEALESAVSAFFASWGEGEGEGEDVTELVCALEAARDEVGDVAQEYREAEDALRGGLAEAAGEKADTLEGWAGALDNAASSLADFDAEDVEFDAEDVERAEGESDEDYDARVEEAREAAVREARKEWRDEVRYTAEDALGECPL